MRKGGKRIRDQLSCGLGGGTPHLDDGEYMWINEDCGSSYLLLCGLSGMIVLKHLKTAFGWHGNDAEGY